MEYSCPKSETELKICCQFKEILRTEEYGKHLEDAISKIQSIGNSTGQVTWFLQ